MTTATLTTAEIETGKALLEKMTPEPWFFDSYCRVETCNKELTAKYHEWEAGIPDNIPDEDLRWKALAASEPKLKVCEVPRRSGDTATVQGSSDAEGIVWLRNHAAGLLAAAEEVERLRAEADLVVTDGDEVITRAEAWKRSFKKERIRANEAEQRIAAIEAALKPFAEWYANYGT